MGPYTRSKWIFLAALLVFTLLMLAAPARAGGGQEPAPNGEARSVSPIVGIVVLLAPLVFIAWKSRGKKEPDIKASSCLPVIDESKRPFRSLEDEEPEDARAIE